MRLTRVRIQGFKTFADRCEFTVDGGVVAVVGPNGCGKSNLVDAILWGLGEGSARTLRAALGVDVIFNGSARRKAMGFAEVTLTFENEDHALPIEAAEVAITRRLDRSGESLYQINRRTCRLKDVHDLFADSGLGRSGYSIVGQKEIDAALSAGAEERRAWIDEAAGVQRYRTRKIDSLRRLTSAKEHLARVETMLREFEAQRGPLERAAVKARRCRELSDALREVEVGLLARSLADAGEQVKACEIRLEEAREVSTTESARADALEVEATEVGVRVSLVEAEMDLARATQQTSLTTIERADASIALIEQRLTSLSEARSGLLGSADEIRQRMADANRDVAIAQEEEDGEKQRLAVLQQETEEDESAMKPITDELAKVDRELAALRREQAARAKAETEAAIRQSRLVEAESERPALAALFDEAEQNFGRANEEVAVIRLRVNEATSDFADARARTQLAEADERETQDRARKAIADVASLEGRRRGIESSISSHDALSHGARSVMNAVKRGDLPARYTPVSDAIRADSELATAIEVALGASMNDLIVPAESDAKAAIELLRRERSGRATFQPIPLMRPPNISTELRRVLNERGVIGQASDEVECSPAVRPVIDSLLGRVVLVESLDDGLRLAKTSGWSRMVSLAGDVVHSSGAVTGGQAGKAASGVVRQRAELAEVSEELEATQRMLGVLQAEASEAKEAVEAARASQSASGETLRLAKSSASEAESRLAAIQRERANRAESLRKLDQRISDLEKVAVPPDGEPIDLSDLEERRESLVRQQTERQAAREPRRRALAETRERLQQAKSRRSAADRRLAQAWEADQLRKTRLDEYEPMEKLLRVDLEQAREQAAVGRAAKASADEQLEAMRVSRAGLLEQSFAASETAKRIRQNLAAIAEGMRQTEIERARASTRHATAFERLFDDYGMSEEAALEFSRDALIPADAPATVSRLRREIRDLGEVSYGSIDAFEELQGRIDHLSAQKEDIESGVRQVEASIHELDLLTRDRFVATFEAVRTAFGETFTELFGGGAGEIELSDPSHMLESGVDISVTLPGKRRQSLALLSGGERALCASAFLFALLKTRTSPLVVMDEVDAPLDGRNVERFAAELQKLSATTQFIVITHNPRTIEMAPVWLGVTMQEPGVSSLVPARPPKGEAS